MTHNYIVSILTHRRPDNQKTLNTLRRCGYEGRVVFLVDDEDPTVHEYKSRYGDDVCVFSKREVGEKIDEGDQAHGRASILWARAANAEIAKRLGYDYVIQLDDDYTDFGYRGFGMKHGEYRWAKWGIRSLDRVFEAMIDFVHNTGITTLAMSQGGDHFCRKSGLGRKAMNSLVFHVDRPPQFKGRLNDDVNTYVTDGNRGSIFFTYYGLQLEQMATQNNAGGMSDLYRKEGTYAKSAFTLLYAPSCVKLKMMGLVSPRLHHLVKWKCAVPKILSETHTVKQKTFQAQIATPERIRT